MSWWWQGCSRRGSPRWSFPAFCGVSGYARRAYNVIRTDVLTSCGVVVAEYALSRILPKIGPPPVTQRHVAEALIASVAARDKERLSGLALA